MIKLNFKIPIYTPRKLVVNELVNSACSHNKNKVKTQPISDIKVNNLNWNIIYNLIARLDLYLHDSASPQIGALKNNTTLIYNIFCPTLKQVYSHLTLNKVFLTLLLRFISPILAFLLMPDGLRILLTDVIKSNGFIYMFILLCVMLAHYSMLYFSFRKISASDLCRLVNILAERALLYLVYICTLFIFYLFTGLCFDMFCLYIPMLSEFIYLNVVKIPLVERAMYNLHAGRGPMSFWNLLNSDSNPGSPGNAPNNGPNPPSGNNIPAHPVDQRHDEPAAEAAHHPDPRPALDTTNFNTLATSLKARCEYIAMKKGQKYGIKTAYGRDLGIVNHSTAHVMCLEAFTTFPQHPKKHWSDTMIYSKEVPGVIPERSGVGTTLIDHIRDFDGTH